MEIFAFTKVFDLRLNSQFENILPNSKMESLYSKVYDPVSKMIIFSLPFTNGTKYSRMDHVKFVEDSL